LLLNGSGCAARLSCRLLRRWWRCGDIGAAMDAARWNCVRA